MGREPLCCHSFWERVNLCCGSCKRRIGVERKGSHPKGASRGRKDYRVADHQKEARRAGKCLPCRKLAGFAYKLQRRPRGPPGSPQLPRGSGHQLILLVDGWCAQHDLERPPRSLCVKSAAARLRLPGRRDVGEPRRLGFCPCSLEGRPCAGHDLRPLL